MSQKKPRGRPVKTAEEKARISLNFRCLAADLELFDAAAKADGFLSPDGTPNRTVWILTKLRREARKSLKDQPE